MPTSSAPGIMGQGIGLPLVIIPAGAVPTLVGFGALTAQIPSVSGTLSIPYAATVTGDYLWLVLASRRAVDFVPTIPTGWTQLHSDTGPGGGNPRQVICERDTRAVGDESGGANVSVDYTVGGNQALTTCWGRIIAFRNVNTGTRIESSTVGSASASATIPFGAVTPTGIRRLAVQISSCPDTRTATITTNGTGGTWVQDANDGIATPGNGGMFDLCTADLDSGAAISGGELTLDGALTSNNARRSLALIGT